MQNSPEYLSGKLEAIHEDVRTLKIQVDELRQSHYGRLAVNKFIYVCLAVLSTTVGWLVTCIGIP